MVAGFFVAPPRGPLMIGAGLVLGSLAGLELAAREHFAGYRSHSLVLAGAAALILMGVLWWFGAEVVQIAVPVRIAVVALAFIALLWVFSRAFARRSGGVPFKIRGD